MLVPVGRTGGRLPRAHGRQALDSATTFGYLSVSLICPAFRPADEGKPFQHTNVTGCGEPGCGAE
jgi:hypothetical protein